MYVLSLRASASWMVIFVKVLETQACGNRIVEECHLRAESSAFAVWYLIAGLLDWIALLAMLPGLLESIQLTGSFADAGQTLMEGFWQLQNMATEWIDNEQSPVSPPAVLEEVGFAELCPVPSPWKGPCVLVGTKPVKLVSLIQQWFVGCLQTLPSLEREPCNFPDPSSHPATR